MLEYFDDLKRRAVKIYSSFGDAVILEKIENLIVTQVTAAEKFMADKLGETEELKIFAEDTVIDETKTVEIDGCFYSCAPPDNALFQDEVNVIRLTSVRTGSVLQHTVLMPVPDPPWDILDVYRNHSVPIYVVIDPDLSTEDSAYVDGIRELQDAGIKVLGHVDTLSDISDAIDSLYSWYDVDGVYLDNVSPNYSAVDYGVYSDMVADIRSYDDDAIIIADTGIPADDMLFNLFDVIVTWSGAGTPTSFSTKSPTVQGEIVPDGVPVDLDRFYYVYSGHTDVIDTENLEALLTEIEAYYG